MNSSKELSPARSDADETHWWIAYSAHSAVDGTLHCIRTATGENAEPKHARARRKGHVMEIDWVAGDFDVKCYAQENEAGAWEGRVLVGSLKDGERAERFLDCQGTAATEAKAVNSAAAWARRQSPADDT
jgi:hypothetical protein